MTQKELITKQQLMIEDFKQRHEENKDILKILNYRINGIGQPLNDNFLKMNKDQMQWVLGINALIESIE